LLAAAAIAAVLAALGLGLYGMHTCLLVDYWESQLKTIPEDEASGLLDQAVQLGEPGIPVLVNALGSPRPSVARAAKQALGDEMARWELLGARDSTRRVAALAQALAEHVDGFGAAARRDAAQLATRILLWPTDRGAAETQRVVASCEKVLHGTRGTEWRHVRPAEVDRPSAQIRGTRLSSGLVAEAGPAVKPPAPNRMHGEDQGRGAMTRTETATARRLPSIDPWLPALSEEHLPVRVEPKLASREGVPQDRSFPEDTERLMHQLRSENGWVAQAARAELIRRGFSEVRLQLARQLFDPDPNVRKMLLRALPQLQSVDPEPWIRQLTRDPSAEIRREALAALARIQDASAADQPDQTARTAGGSRF
jgi:HEAT repeat protein